MPKLRSNLTFQWREKSPSIEAAADRRPVVVQIVGEWVTNRSGIVVHRFCPSLHDNF